MASVFIRVQQEIWPLREKAVSCGHKPRNTADHQKLEEEKTESSLEPQQDT